MASNRDKEDSLEDCFQFLSKETKDLCWRNYIEEEKGAPDALSFLRDWVSQNRPVIFRDAVKSWPACHLWTKDYLRKEISCPVTVAVTPNGYADAVYNGQFTLPEERTMLFSEFLDILENPERDNGIFYIQKQNDNFIEEFNGLSKDIAKEPSWATDAFGKVPEAVNFWMGDKRAVTSMHRDHYENIYCVVSGYKDFILHPPTDLPWIPYENYPVTEFYQGTDGKWCTKPKEPQSTVWWIPVNPLKPDRDRFPGYANAHQIRCRVFAGDAFYLPSLWFHHVQQSHGCIAINYWYDMQYDIKYSYYKFLEKVVHYEKRNPI